MRVGELMFEDVICPHLRAVPICRMEEDHRGVLVIREERIGTFLLFRQKEIETFGLTCSFEKLQVLRKSIAPNGQHMYKKTLLYSKNQSFSPKLGNIVRKEFLKERELSLIILVLFKKCDSKCTPYISKEIKKYASKQIVFSS